LTDTGDAPHAVDEHRGMRSSRDRPRTIVAVTLLFHVDESRDKVHHFHVGLLLAGADAVAAEVALNKIVKDAMFAGACWSGSELHGYEIFNRQGDWSRATIPQAINIFDQSLAVLSTGSIEVLVRGAQLAPFQTQYPGSDPYRWEFRNLLERLNERLTTRDEYGLVIADQHHEYRDILQRDVINSKVLGTGGYRSQKLLRIVDTAHFVDSRLSRMTQLTDMVAFIVRRRASTPREADPRAETVMARLWQLVWNAIPDPRGQYHTIRL
jgi:Protein of unknown function (DUF3800)